MVARRAQTTRVWNQRYGAGDHKSSPLRKTCALALLASPLHAQLHPSALHIHAQHAHVAVGKLGDMHQAVLLDADIDEGTEVHQHPAPSPARACRAAGLPS